MATWRGPDGWPCSTARRVRARRRLPALFDSTHPTMWIEIGQDGFAQNLIDRWVLVNTNADGERSDGFTFVRRDDGLMTVDVGPVGSRLSRGYRQAVGALARTGKDVVVDEAKFDDGGWADWSSALYGLPVTWVRVECARTVLTFVEKS